MKLYIFILSIILTNSIRPNGIHRLLRDLNIRPPINIDITQDDNSILKQLRTIYIHNSGMDEHCINDTLDGKKLYNITKTFILSDILRNLENTDISESKKLEYLEQYDDWNDSSKYTTDLTNGGLFDDWNFTI
jgi:hypothetical protein